MAALTEQDIIDFLRDELGVDTSDVDANSVLFSSGIVDSFAMVSLIAFIESRVNVRVSPMDVNLDNFDTVKRMLAFVEAAQGDR